MYVSMPDIEISIFSSENSFRTSSVRITVSREHGPIYIFFRPLTANRRIAFNFFFRFVQKSSDIVGKKFPT